MSKANGQVRPAWMGGPAETEQQDQVADTAPAPERDTYHREEVQQDQHTPTAEEISTSAPHPEPEEQTETAASTQEEAPQQPEKDVSVAHEQDQPPAPGLDQTERIGAEPFSAQPAEDNDTSARDNHPAALSSGKKTEAGAAAARSAYPHSSSAAPVGIKAAISSFVERISGGKRQSVPKGGSPGGGSSEREAAEPTRTESAEQVEKRLRRSLRETTIEGFRRIAFGSPKGGVGKSSLAYTVAGAIARSTNLRVCLVDADPNFGATRYLVPRPVEQSVLDLADDAERLERLADLRTYVSQNEQMGLDVLLNPVEAAQISSVEDLSEAYAKVDAVLSRFYDLVIYDLGLGFRDEAIRGVLELSDELVLISDAEVIPNAQLPDALRYVEGLGVNLQKTTLTINHGRPPDHESASTTEVRGEYAGYVRRVTEVPYDAALSQLLNTRAFHIESLSLPARLGVLTTAAAALEGLRRDAWTDGYEKVLSLHPDKANNSKGGR